MEAEVITEDPAMRIMEIISGTAVNGAVINCLEIVRALRARGHQVTVVCRPGAWIARQLPTDDGQLIESDLHRWPTDELRRIAREAHERRIDVVHTHMSSASFFGVLLRRLYGIPACVATAHNRYVQLHWMFNDRVIAVSEATRRFHRRYNLVRPKRIEVVHNFICEERFHAVSREQGLQLRAELGISSDRLLLGYVGDLIPRKGLLHLIAALPRILHNEPRAHLLCVGHQHHEYAGRCRAEAERLGVASAITWAGPRGDVERVLAGIEVYVLPSVEENLPLAILEAMASGRPVVATDVGGIGECVVDGRTGILVPAAAHEPLAAALSRLLADADLRRQFGEAGRERVHACFSAERQIRRIEAIFAGLARKAA
jgi:glycosyltransferase involved in cell wall biosynthesis